MKSYFYGMVVNIFFLSLACISSDAQSKMIKVAFIIEYSSFIRHGCLQESIVTCIPESLICTVEQSITLSELQEKLFKALISYLSCELTIEQKQAIYKGIRIQFFPWQKGHFQKTKPFEEIDVRLLATDRLKLQSRLLLPHIYIEDATLAREILKVRSKAYELSKNKRLKKCEEWNLTLET